VNQQQAGLNTAVWRDSDFVRAYAIRTLRPPEVIIFARYRGALAGRVLELGCGAGRLSGHLAEIGGDVHGIDVSRAMIDYCSRTYPKATFDVGDLRDLAAFEDDSIDSVVAGFNVIDVVDDAERCRVLADIHRILRPGGLIVMSSHNREYKMMLPLRAAFNDGALRLPLRLLALPLQVRNRRRVLPLQRWEQDYAILNDSAHRYQLLHYYTNRDAQDRQFRLLGFELLECLDGDGNRVEAGETADAYSELHYVARRGD
jgi:SAM-dependent methyltransferase